MPWREVTLAEVVEVNPSRILSKNSAAPFIPMEALKPFCRDPGEVEYKTYAGGKKFRNRDTIVASITPCLENGKTAYIKCLPDDQTGFGSTEYLVLAPKNGITDSLFIYYLSRSSAFRSHAIQCMNGSSGRQRVQVEPLKQFRFLLPPIAFQRTVAEILGSLDDKIELNRKMNDAVEQMARAIFKSWFLDFSPVYAKSQGEKPIGMDDATALLFPDSFEQSEMGKIPKGWSPALVSELFEVNPKYSLAKGAETPYTEMADLPVGSMSVTGCRPRAFTSGSRFSNGDTLIARITPCLENGKTAYVDFLDDGQIGWGSTEFIVLRSKMPFPLEASYLLAREESFRTHLITNMSGSSGRQRVPESCLSRFSFAKPTPQVAMAFGTLVKPLFQLMRSNSIESTTLAQTRDLLLPRLLSGEISVMEAVT